VCSPGGLLDPVTLSGRRAAILAGRRGALAIGATGEFEAGRESTASFVLT
jgi:hypothetical protein